MLSAAVEEGVLLDAVRHGEFADRAANQVHRDPACQRVGRLPIHSAGGAERRDRGSAGQWGSVGVSDQLMRLMPAFVPL